MLAGGALHPRRPAVLGRPGHVVRRGSRWSLRDAKATLRGGRPRCRRRWRGDAHPRGRGRPHAGARRCRSRCRARRPRWAGWRTADERDVRQRHLLLVRLGPTASPVSGRRDRRRRAEPA
jgi:hypothetical protein